MVVVGGFFVVDVVLVVLLVVPGFEVVDVLLIVVGVMVVVGGV